MSDFKIVKETDPDLKGEICNQILRALPNWFGIESSIVEYVNDVRRMETWISYDGDRAVGFITINRHFETSAEIHVMGIFPAYHRKGIGHGLIKAIEPFLQAAGVHFLTVKTISENRVDPHYAQTRQFYLRMGFVPLEEFKTLWGAHNPCLMFIKSLG